MTTKRAVAMAVVRARVEKLLAGSVAVSVDARDLDTQIPDQIRDQRLGEFRARFAPGADLVAAEKVAHAIDSLLADDEVIVPDSIN